MTTEVLERPAPVAELRQSRSTVPLLLFAGTSFLSAFLLQVQLIVNKHILPWFGGSAAVWTTSMLVFQVLLLVGYIYSHLITTRLTPSRQFTLHAIVLSAAVAVVLASSLAWPSAITPGTGWKPRKPITPSRVFVSSSWYPRVCRSLC
jgi:glucan phosphoethanolaminetransferase (alkaline phosphatase superfamily)